MKRIGTAILYTLTVMLVGCGAPQRVDRNSFHMGTWVVISVYNTRHAKYIEECFTLLANLEAEVSTNIPDSAISRLNSSGQARLQGDLADILRAAKLVSDASGGAFNIGVLPLQRLWDVQNRLDGEQPPTQSEIDIARELSTTGIDISDDGDALDVQLQKGRGLDLGGIAKGYAGDRCAGQLKENGVNRALINIGGNVRTVGDGEFRVGLRNPRGRAEDLFGLVTVGECNIVTSGDYERYFQTDGIRYHHIYDPETGKPARSGLLSATAIGENGAFADGLSTAIFVMGREEGLALAVNMGYDAVVVTEDYKVYCTENIRASLEIVNDEFELVSD